MSWLVEGTRKKQDDKHMAIDQTPTTYGNENGNTSKDSQSNGYANGEDAKKPATLATKHAETGHNSGTAKLDGTQKRNTKSNEGTTVTAKGAPISTIAT